MKSTRIQIRIIDDGSIPFGDMSQNRGFVIDAYAQNWTTETFTALPGLMTGTARDFQDYINRLMDVWDQRCDDKTMGETSVHGDREKAVLTFFIDNDWWQRTWGVDPAVNPPVITHFFDPGVTLRPVPVDVVVDPHVYECTPIPVTANY